MRSNIYVLCILAVVFSAASCTKNGLVPGRRGPSSQIRLSVRSGEPFSKSSAADDAPGTLIASYPLSDDPGNGLVLSVYERDFTELPSLMSSDAEAAGTKGEVMTTSELTTFRMLAYADAPWHDNTIAAGASGSESNPYDRGLYFGGTDGIAVNRSGSAGSYEWNLASEQYWLNEVPISFWSWNGAAPGSVVWNGTTESYDQATLNGFTVNGTVTDQIDPIFAYNGESRTFDNTGSITGKTSTNSAYTRTDNEVDIRFRHALAAVNFDISEVGPGRTVDNIALSNIFSKGNCSIDASSGVPQFSWTPASDSKTEFSQAFTSSDFNSSGRQPLDNGKVFLMIPQELDEDAGITVTFNGTTSVTRSLHIPDAFTWKAGKYYTYAIKRTGDIYLELVSPTMPVDAHYGNAILRFSKTEITSAEVTLTNPDGTTTTFNPLSATTPANASWVRFAKPAEDASTFASYPGSSGTVDISGLLAELNSTGTKSHFLEYNGYYYTQAFIDEYYLPGQTLSTFVNKPDRKFSLKISKGSKSTEPVVISQKSIQSPYNLLTAANPIGVEFVEETSVTAGTDASEWCLSRNRDEDGNGTIEGSEIKWRVPSLQEYWNVWYGTYSIHADAWLGAAHYLSSDGKAYNGTNSTTVTTPSGTGTVRCVRDLGSGSVGSLMSSVSITDGDYGKVYAINTQNVSSESLRSKITGREISGAISPGAGTDAADNKLYSKIQVASKYLTWPVSGVTQTYSKFEFNLAVSKDRDQAIDDFYVSCDQGKTVIEGTVKMVNPDPRLVYTTSFTKLNGAVDPKPGTEWSYLDSKGVLHFHVEYTGWSAQNSGSGWILKAGIKEADGTVTNISGSSNICTLYFVITKKDVSGDWGTGYTANPPSINGGIMIGDEPIQIGTQEKFRLVVVDGGPWSVQNVTMPVTSELFEGTGTNDNKKYAEYACRNYYYEDTRFKAGVESKSDLGQWRAPNQRELNMILEHGDELPVLRMTETGNFITVGDHSTPEYQWFPDYGWASGTGFDKISSLRITYSSAPYFNNNGILSTGGTAPYKIRCVRDLE